MDFDGNALRWPLYVALSARQPHPPDAGGDATLWVCWFVPHLDAEIRNGGFTQLFYNMHQRGLTSDACLPALEAIGAPAAVALASRALRRLDRDETDRACLWAKGPFEAPAGLDRDLRALSARWLSLEPSVLQRLGSWLDQHREDPALVGFIAEARVQAEGSGDGSTPLHAAALDGDAPRVRRLLADGADPRAVDVRGHTPLIEALYDTSGTRARLAIVRALVEAGASLANCDQFGTGVLGLSSADPERVKTLLALGADPAEGRGGQSPLHRARHPEVIRVLAEAGAPVDATDEHGCTPWLRQLDSASGRRGKLDLSVHEALLAAGADPSWVDLQGRDAFSHADGNLALLAWLQKKGLRPSTRPDHRGLEGETALHRAAAQGQAAVLKRLLAMGAPVNARLRAASHWLQGHAGATPLDLARTAGQKAAASMLVAAGGEAGEALGHAVVLLAAERGRPELEALLDPLVEDAATLARSVPATVGRFVDEEHRFVQPAVVVEGMERVAAEDLAAAIGAAGGVARVL